MAKQLRDKYGRLVIVDSTDRYWYNKGFDDALLSIRPRNRKAHYIKGYREGVHYAETMKKHTGRDPLPGKNRNAGTGKAFTFHGSFTSKILARRKEKEIPGSFIEERDGRYYVLKPRKIPTSTFYEPRAGAKNPPKGAVKIYGRCLRIEAVKLRSHLYGGKSTRGDQKYFHDFTTKHAMIYGLPDGSLLIKA